jgi:hypothetical protein
MRVSKGPFGGRFESRSVVPNYESRGREFESLRARHLVLICEHSDRSLRLPRTAFSSKSFLPLDPDLVIIDFDFVDERLQVGFAERHS